MLNMVKGLKTDVNICRNVLCKSKSQASVCLKSHDGLTVVVVEAVHGV